tara:strand:+ start:422 stop:583 length:162 start_codon:yes stop_codon:yes gene_type:complete
MTSDAKIGAYAKNIATENGAVLSDEDLQKTIDALKEMTPEQLSYLTRNTAEPA